MDIIRGMEAFVALATAGSFVAAADKLGTSTAAVSRQIAALETHLGARLVHRTTRRLHPTAEGVALAERGRALVDELDALTVELGLLRIHRAVERRVLLARDALAGVQHSVKRLARVVRKALARIERFSLEPVVEQEVERGAQGGGHARNYGRDGPMKPVRWVTRTAGVHWIARWNTGALAKSPSRRLGIARDSGVRSGGHRRPGRFDAVASRGFATVQSRVGLLQGRLQGVCICKAL